MNIFNKKFSLFEILNLIGSFCSIISVILYFIPTDNKIFLLIRIIILIIVIALWALIILYYRNKINTFNKIFKSLHNISHCIRDVLNKENDKNFDTQVRNGMVSVCTFTRDIFTLLTKYQCCACIKLISDKDDNKKKDQVVFTFARDEDSKIERDSYSHKEYTVEGNTDFSIIFFHNKDHYLNNDLLKAKEENQYDNENTDFFKYYMSTLVVPIRIKKVNGAYTVIGFLAIDSKVKNTFNNNNQKQILGIIADNLYIILFKLNEWILYNKHK